MSNYSCINQHAVDVHVETPLAHLDAQEGVRKQTIELYELPAMGHFNLRLNPENAEQMQAAQSLLGVALPTQPCSSVRHESLQIDWVAPDDWLVLMPFDQAAGFERRYRETMPGHYSIVDVSGGQTVIRLGGEYAREVLMKGCPIDVASSEFPIGKAVSTAFAKSAAHIVRVDADVYWLVVRRSFADYLWAWLTDACADYR